MGNHNSKIKERINTGNGKRICIASKPFWTWMIAGKGSSNAQSSSHSGQCQALVCKTGHCWSFGANQKSACRRLEWLYDKQIQQMLWILFNLRLFFSIKNILRLRCRSLCGGTRVQLTGTYNLRPGLPINAPGRKLRYQHLQKASSQSEWRTLDPTAQGGLPWFPFKPAAAGCKVSCTW